MPKLRYEIKGWTVTCPAPGKKRFIGHDRDTELGRAFFDKRGHAVDYRRDCLDEVRHLEAFPGDYRVVRATLTLTAFDSQRSGASRRKGPDPAPRAAGKKNNTSRGSSRRSS